MSTTLIFYLMLMLKKELQEIIANGENSGVEFKRDPEFIVTEDYLKTVLYSRGVQ
ncbi:MAG: hypothetical protein Q3M24_17230 [Candidatus Electrothrix aestuarii]|uniref:Uncharacterized protein n=1 Tax=Candidatus Electrothrix aestuarii TaxID=3062594 RepID=A0AAU8LRU4_9BACT|nr:hypothetical protein [Candidatus Electrothrix aestuarii]